MLDHAIGLLRKGQLEKSREVCEVLVQQHPENFEALHLLGVIAGLNNDHQKAIEIFSRAIRVKPNSSEAYNNLGNAQKELKLLDAAIASYDKAVCLKADNAQAYRNRGIALHELNKLESAIASYNKAIEIRSEYAQAYMNRGISLYGLGMPHAAIASYDKAIELYSEYAEAYMNRGIALQKQGMQDSAVASYDKAISLKPDYFEAYYNRGNALTELRQLNLAIASYDEAISIKPEHAEAQWNKALALLKSGNLEEGWKLYEWRWQRIASGKMKRQDFVQPLWLGNRPLKGARVLLHAEQGLGDTIQFCRYATLVAELGAYVILQVPHALVGLMEGLTGVSEVIDEEKGVSNFDAHCPLMSLPLAFNTKLDSIPYSNMRYLGSDKKKVAEWSRRLGPKLKRRIGLVWSGGVRPDQPGSKDANERRNLSLEKLKALVGIDAEFFSLQKGEPAESEFRQKLQDGWNGPEIRNVSDCLLDFTDTAALIENLDLVISVDTSTAHLAGALGKSVWILNRYDGDWRWLLGRNDSPWYSTVKLFNQDSVGNWDGVISRVRQSLLEFILQ